MFFHHAIILMSLFLQIIQQPRQKLFNDACIARKFQYSRSVGRWQQRVQWLLLQWMHNSPPAFWVSTSVDDLTKRQPSDCRDIVHQ